MKSHYLRFRSKAARAAYEAITGTKLPPPTTRPAKTVLPASTIDPQAFAAVEKPAVSPTEDR